MSEDGGARKGGHPWRMRLANGVIAGLGGLAPAFGVLFLFGADPESILSFCILTWLGFVFLTSGLMGFSFEVRRPVTIFVFGVVSGMTVVVVSVLFRLSTLEHFG